MHYSVFFACLFTAAIILQSVSSDLNSTQDGIKTAVETGNDVDSRIQVNKARTDNDDLFPNVDISQVEKSKVNPDTEKKDETNKEINSVEDDKKNKNRLNILKRLRGYLKKKSIKPVQDNKIDNENEIIPEIKHNDNEIVAEKEHNENEIIPEVKHNDNEIVPEKEHNENEIIPEIKPKKYEKARRQFRRIINQYLLRNGPKLNAEDAGVPSGADVANTFRLKVIRARIDSSIRNVNRTINIARRSEENYHKQVSYLTSSFENKTKAEAEKMRLDLYKMIHSANEEKPEQKESLQECIQGDIDAVNLLLKESLVNLDMCVDGATKDIKVLIAVLSTQIKDLSSALVAIVKRLESCEVIGEEVNSECLGHILSQLSPTSPISHAVAKITSTVIRNGLLVALLGNDLHQCGSPILAIINSTVATSIASLLDCITAAIKS